MGSGAHPSDHMARVSQSASKYAICYAKKTEEEVRGQITLGNFGNNKHKQVPLLQDCEYPTGDTMYSDFQIHLPKEHCFSEYVSGLLSRVICF